MPAPEAPVTASALPDYAKRAADKEAVLTFEKPAIPSVVLGRRPLPLWSLDLAFLDGFLAFAALIGVIFSPRHLDLLAVLAIGTAVPLSWFVWLRKPQAGAILTVTATAIFAVIVAAIFFW